MVTTETPEAQSERKPICTTISVRAKVRARVRARARARVRVRVREGYG